MAAHCQPDFDNVPRIASGLAEIDGYANSGSVSTP